jgi:hypothetical protein
VRATEQYCRANGSGAIRFSTSETLPNVAGVVAPMHIVQHRYAYSAIGVAKITPLFFRLIRPNRSAHSLASCSTHVALIKKSVYLPVPLHHVGIFYIVNPFLFNILIIIVPKIFLRILPIWSCRYRWRDQITLSHHMHWRDNTCHVRQHF